MFIYCSYTIIKTYVESTVIYFGDHDLPTVSIVVPFWDYLLASLI